MKRIALLIVLGFSILFGQTSETNAQIKFPKITPPKIKIPKVKPPKIPKVEIPKVGPPKLELPKIPKIGPPKLELPKIPKIGPPKLELPKIPKIGPPIPGPIDGIDTFPIPNPFPDLTNPIKVPDPIKAIGGNLEAKLKQKARAFEGDINKATEAFSRAIQVAREDFERLAQAVKNKDGGRAAKLVRSIMEKSPEFADMVTHAITRNLQSITIFGSVGASLGKGGEGGLGIALSTSDLVYGDKIQGSVFIGGALSAGLQAGGGVDLAIGFSAPHPSSLTGPAYGGGVDFKVKAGGSASVTFDMQHQFSGFAVGLGGGAEMGFKLLVAYTHVLKSFKAPVGLPARYGGRPTQSVQQSQPTYPTPGSPQNWPHNPIQVPQIQGETYPGGTYPELGTQTPSGVVNSGQRKMLGVHSITTQTISQAYQWGQQVTQVVPGSAAQRAGLETGDTIVAVNGALIQSEQALRQAIQNSGSQMWLKVVNVRTGQLVDIQVNF